jgi:putative SOS response-associated peptidase YedK
MAAVWKVWKNPKTDQWEPTFAILTGEPNELMAPVHDRMTTFIEPRDYEEYLAPSERPPVHLLRILPADKMKTTLVGATPITMSELSWRSSKTRKETHFPPDAISSSGPIGGAHSRNDGWLCS